ncbi:Sec39 domain-containing protein [Mariannaea sp. PMI_226]|nr:Sec39 domain-containing protein [Mariannaea sp. PMI_226]
MAVTPPLGPAKVVLLAVHFATQADVNSLVYLTAQHASVLRQDLILRILLTHLPETIKPDVYVPFLRSLAANESPSHSDVTLDTAAVDGISDDQAIRRVKKLQLLHLTNPDTAPNSDTDPLTCFLFIRGYRMDDEAGMLTLLPDLLIPFLEHTPIIRTWLVATILPLLRRNHEYHPQSPIRYSLLEFENLPDRDAIDYLLAETGASEDNHSLLGRDFKGLIGPWLFNDSRWRQMPAIDGILVNHSDEECVLCPGWEQALEWLVKQASTSWVTALKTIEQWDGPSDIDLIDDVNLWFQEPQQRYLEQTYARAALASAYLVPDATVDALQGAWQICIRIRSLMGEDAHSTLQSEASLLSPARQFDPGPLPGPKIATYMRNDLLKPTNPLTALNSQSLNLLEALVLSAFLMTRAGVPCSVRRAGELALLQDQRDQKSEIARLIRTLCTLPSKNDDNHWTCARKEILWLHSWGIQDPSKAVRGVFGSVSAEHIETEILKALLSQGRYDLARSLYEDASETLLSRHNIQNTIQTAALNAFDNASNPNRSRGGLKKCDEIINAFPNTMGKTLPITRKIEALLKATHALSNYRLVLKQGEPFSPVILRVHSDPVSIIEKVLEQNAKAYTRLQEFLELGNNIAMAGLPVCHVIEKQESSLGKQESDRPLIEKRIVAMCIEGALREDDFETAYSYVLSRLGASSSTSEDYYSDEWSWKAALNAGKYVRTERSLKPTHLGTASGNPEIRHLEQRIECLATALRIAPSTKLQEVLKTFRRCEEQLDFAIREEAAKEEAWDAAGDLRNLPGAFDGPDPNQGYPPRNITASSVARQTDEAPMSLFDLSRATARVASRNLTAFSGLQGIAQGSPQTQKTEQDVLDHQRARKRDQLREAATGTLAAGVGWLIGANSNRPPQNDQH